MLWLSITPRAPPKFAKDYDHFLKPFSFVHIIHFIYEYLINRITKFYVAILKTPWRPGHIIIRHLMVGFQFGSVEMWGTFSFPLLSVSIGPGVSVGGGSSSWGKG